VSHTWSHPNLDYLPPNECDGKQYTCPTQPERVLAELDYNVKTVTGQGIDAAAYHQVFQGMYGLQAGFEFKYLKYKIWRQTSV
jgi:peptidoglycan/xylan/chitin deacetylase (PgdA/CDA1 family)